MANPVDIIIPVYNNVHLTISCVHSVFKYLSKNVNSVIIHDDCSSQETNTQLHQLAAEHNDLNIIRSEQNIGFAAGVNKACAASTAAYLLILNSDTEIKADILTPMLEILQHNPQLAAINPSGPVYTAKKLKRCSKIPCSKTGLSYIASANASGYALLIKRELFNKMGGFNTVYGRGYYEDTELSRVLINNGHQLAIYKTDEISHVGQSSFKTLNTAHKTTNFAKDLIQKNKEVYLQRNPKAKQTYKTSSFKSDFNELPEKIQKKIIDVTLNGGSVTINGLFTPKNLPFYQIKFKKLKLLEILALVFSSS